MEQILEQDFLDFDDCFPDGIIVDGENVDINEVDKIMSKFLSSKKD